MTTWSILSKGMRRKRLSTQVWRTTPSNEGEGQPGMPAEPCLLLETGQSPSREQQLASCLSLLWHFPTKKGWVPPAGSTAGQTDPQL